MAWGAASEWFGCPSGQLKAKRKSLINHLTVVMCHSLFLVEWNLQLFLVEWNLRTDAGDAAMKSVPPAVAGGSRRCQFPIADC